MEHRATWVAAGLELRRQGKQPVIAGAFPFNTLATIADRGRVRKERIAPGAFDWTLEKEDREVSLLLGHSFDRPLASRRNGSLTLRADDAALSFEATIDPALEDVSHVRDALALLASGLVKGISPGFRVPPKETLPDAERLDPEPGNPGVFIRTILQLVLYELSLVTRPAYEASQAELRAMQNAAHPVRAERIILP
ncbi:HK97 family phage prohead protease [Sagittula sp. MA-2]|jgi:HK97 family phage prohead protease|uniref:HK97 family phage prohead protease n=1 Tax=Sagittula sp. MA-2 TaxID=3048007 RepID=UPI0024C2EDD1|nr:HK97 family phage prohead protease [Sagittula sp. MA-2]WHZ37505.1 HK97 family phage prohead protease [Sagittula sp. MA-2]